MKTVRPIVLILIPLLFSCFPKKPEMYGTEVPAGPAVAALEQQRQSFTGLKAVASLEVVRRGKRSFFENTGIVLDGQRRFRIEAYGPLGQTLFAIVWDGSTVRMRLPGDDRVLQQEPAGLAKYLGEGMEARELSALLSGSVPLETPRSDSKLFCGERNDCTLELSRTDRVRRIGVSYQTSGQGGALRIVSQELYHADRVVYQASFLGTAGSSPYSVPKKIVIKIPDENMQITIEYDDVDVNCPIADEAFVLNNGEAWSGDQ